jgi:hypothetical protein
MKWPEILIFLVNYVAHPITVKALPGEKDVDMVSAMFLVIICPFQASLGVLRLLHDVHYSIAMLMPCELQLELELSALLFETRTGYLMATCLLITLQMIIQDS